MREVVEPLIWWLILYGIYLGIISSVSPTELIVGAAAAGVGAAAAVATRRVLLRGLDVSFPRLGRLLLLPPQILRDSTLLIRPGPRGGFTEVPVPPCRGSGVVTLVLSVSPGTYVAQVTPDRTSLLVHRAEERPSRLEREVTSC